MKQRIAERFDFLGQSAEAEIAEERDGRRPIDAARPTITPIEFQRYAVVEPHQIAAQQRLLAVRDQVFLEFRALHFRGMGENFIERAELFDKLPGGLGADLRHAGHVIDRIAHQRLKIDHLRGRNPPLFLQFLPIDKLVFADVIHFHALGDELPAVFVGRHQNALAAEFLDDPRQGGHHVVGLERFAIDRGNAQHGKHAADGRDLRHQIGVHFGPLNFVLAVHRMAKSLARQIEGAKQIIGLLVLEQIEQIPRKPEHGPHRLAPRTAHLRQGMKHLMNE